MFMEQWRFGFECCGPVINQYPIMWVMIVILLSGSAFFDPEKAPDFIVMVFMFFILIHRLLKHWFAYFLTLVLFFLQVQWRVIGRGIVPLWCWIFSLVTCQKIQFYQLSIFKRLFFVSHVRFRSCSRCINRHLDIMVIEKISNDDNDEKKN